MAQLAKNLLAKVGDMRDVGSVAGSRILGEGNGNPLRYSCPENSMDRGAGWATVHVVTASQTQLSAHICTLLACEMSAIGR